MIQSFKMAFKSIAGNKMRAFLTMLGIIIGVMALVILVSLVSGATGRVTDTISGLGSDMITVTVSDDKGKPIPLDTLLEWGEKRQIGAIAPSAQGSMTGKYGSEAENVTVYGTTPGYAQIEDLEIMLGRFLKLSDVENHTNVCVISKSIAEDLIGFTDCLGEEIALNGTKFTVAGVLEDSDNSLTAMFRGGTMVAYVPYTTLVRLSDSVPATVSAFYVINAADFTVDETTEAVKELLMERFDEDEDAFRVSSTNILEDAMSSITSILSILLGGIASISLIVGGIGIMNIMLVTVTERTREIGIRKAIGATRGAILLQFLIEAVVLCMFGCIIGIFVSWGFLRIISTIVSSLSMTFELEGTVVAVAVGFCLFIGVVFGLYPANKAAKMPPIEALHYGG